MPWKPKAQIEFANDLITASLVLDEGSDTRTAIQQIANALISSALEADPTLAGNVLQVATSAVGTAIVDRQILTGAYPVNPRHGKALILASGGRQLAAWNRSDGSIDDATARDFGRRIGDVGALGLSRRTSSRHPWSILFSSGGRAVMYVDKVDAKLKYIDGTPISGDAGARLQLIIDGDSTSNNSDAGDIPFRWWSRLSSRLGLPVVPRGASGATIGEVTAVAGTFRPTATPAGGGIPASGPVTLTNWDHFPQRVGQAPASLLVDVYTRRGAVVRGTLTRVDSSTATFTRATTGAAITSATVRVQSVVGRSQRDCIRLFSAGINDEPEIVRGNRTVQFVKDRYLEFVTAHDNSPGELWVWSILDRGRNEGTGGDYSSYPNAANIIYAYIAELETYLSNLLGVRFIPVRRYLSSQQALDDAAWVATLLGRTFAPTADDIATVQAGHVPASFRESSGSVHLNDLGSALQAFFMEDWIRTYSTATERFTLAA